MDHSHMDHSRMGHGDMGHGDMDHGDMDQGGNKCSMNMLFTWSSKNLCIVFSQWHVTGTLSLILSLLAIVALTAGYEWVRRLSRQYEQGLKARLQAFAVPSTSNSLEDEPSSSLTAGKDARLAVERRGLVIKAAFYALQIFYSFFIMLLFMTYNGWVMLAVAVGAFVGYILFGQDSGSTKTMACH